MSSTTDFQEWLKNVELEDHDEVFSLYQAVEKAMTFGNFDVKPARGGGDRWIITVPYLDQSLRIESSDARAAFLRCLEKKYCGDLTMESWHSFKQTESK